MARSPLRPADMLLTLALAGAALVATSSVWLAIAKTGLSSEEQSHILLAPVVAAWLAWLRRGRLRYCRLSPSLWGPLAIAVGWPMSEIGFRTGTDIAWHLGALLVVAGAVVTIAGPGAVRRLLPAALALLFLLPIPGRLRQELALPLQNVTARVGEWSLELLGYPVSRSGNVLEIAGNSVAVAEACNGMRMVSALALIAFAFVFSTPMRNNVRLLILAATPALAILVNLARMVPTVLLFGYASEDTARLFHDLSGWLSLVLALAMLWAMLHFLRWLEFPIGRAAVVRA